MKPAREARREEFRVFNKPKNRRAKRAEKSFQGFYENFTKNRRAQRAEKFSRGFYYDFTMILCFFNLPFYILTFQSGFFKKKTAVFTTLDF